MTCRNALSSLLLIMLVATGISATPSADSRCKTFMASNPDLICLPLSTAKSLDVKVVTLEHDLEVAKLKSRHLGLTLGCGLGVSAFITDSWSTKALPAASCGAYYGYRW